MIDGKGGERMESEISRLFSKADRYKDRIDAARPLSTREAKELSDYFKIGLTYSSNAIEGNTLTISETKVLLEDGLTVGGKPIKDYYEATGHGKAYEYMRALVNSDAPITEAQILELHRLLYFLVDEDTAGKYRTERVFITGTEYLPPAPESVPSQMREAIAYMQSLYGTVHPIEYAALIHKRLVDVHPFTDGNGRTARLLMNLALLREGYGIAIIPPVRRGEYMDALRIAQRENRPDVGPFVSLIAECVIETQKDYCRLLGLPIQDVAPAVQADSALNHSTAKPASRKKKPIER